MNIYTFLRACETWNVGGWPKVEGPTTRRPPRANRRAAWDPQGAGWCRGGNRNVVGWGLDLTGKESSIVQAPLIENKIKFKCLSSFTWKYEIAHSYFLEESDPISKLFKNVNCMLGGGGIDAIFEIFENYKTNLQAVSLNISSHVFECFDFQDVETSKNNICLKFKTTMDSYDFLQYLGVSKI